MLPHNSRMKRFCMLVILFAACLFAAWSFWSLGSVPDRATPTFTQAQENSSVTKEVKSGDTLRTMGEALIVRFADRAQLRLAPNSALTITELAPQPDGSLRLTLSLENGQLRIQDVPLHNQDQLRLHAAGVDVSSFGAGLEFSTSPTATTIFVTRGSAYVRPSQGGDIIVNDGLGLVLGSSLAHTRTKPNPDVPHTTGHQDQQFVKDVLDARHAYLDGLKPAQPQTIGEALTRLAESLHLALSPSRAPQRFAAYTVRRYVGLLDWCSNGHDGAALEAASALEEEMNARIRNDGGAAYHDALQTELPSLFPRLLAIGPSASCYRLKQRIEDLSQKLSAPDAASQSFAQLAIISLQLDEAAAMIDAASLDEAGNELEAAKQGLDQSRHRLTDVKDAQLIAVLEAKQLVLQGHHDDLRVRLATAIAPPTSTITTTSSTVASFLSTTSTADNMIATTTPSVLRSLRILPLTVPLVASSTQTYRAIATYSDDSTKDVTTRVKFESSNLRLGFFVRNLFTTNPDVSGEVIITATFVDKGKTQQASATTNISLR